VYRPTLSAVPRARIVSQHADFHDPELRRRRSGLTERQGSDTACRPVRNVPAPTCAGDASVPTS